MIRTPDIPTSPPKEFDPVEYEKEKEWLDRVTEGKIRVSRTDGGILLSLSTAFVIGSIVGGSIGGLIALFTRSFYSLVIPAFLAFVISLYFLRGDFSRIEIDAERGLILYEGTISFGGEYRSTRYRGPYQIIEGTHLVRFRRFKIFKSKPFIRFLTRSGYLRMNFKPVEEIEILDKLQSLGLVNVQQMEQSLAKDPIKTTDKYIRYYEKRFDRSEFIERMKQQKQQEEHQERINRKIKHKQLIEKSKQYSKESEETTGL